MVDSSVVLWGQTIIYTCYCLVILLLIGWFASAITRAKGAATPVPPKAFYSFVGFLALLGVSLHLVTYSTIPWVKDDLHAAGLTPTATYHITVADHEFRVPHGAIDVPCDKLVKFSVTSQDLTYGFGLFRDDHSMVTQMQVVPGHANELMWRFEEDGRYDIRSTEYSGPAGYQMIVPDAVRVTGCGGSEARP